MKSCLIVLFSFIAISAFADSEVGGGHSDPIKPISPDSTLDPKCIPPDAETEEEKSKIDMNCIEEHLKTTGLGGWVHASVRDQMMFAFTWRRPGPFGFFTNVTLPMASKDPNVLKQIAELKRHDQIVLKGSFFDNEAPIEHINVTELTVVKAYEGHDEKYEYDPDLPKEILSNTSVIAKVHIVANEGKVLVIETGDRVYPVFNKDPKLVDGLYRNDKIELAYQVRATPFRPNHLEVDTAAATPVRVIERIADQHGEEITMSGSLVMFPQSPQIRFNIFAIRQEDAEGINRNFTIINFENNKLFTEIRLMLQKQWDDNIATAEYDRNKFINRKIKVTVKGIKNLVSPNQANPQVIPDKMEDVTVSVMK